MNLPQELIDKILDYREEILFKERFKKNKPKLLFNSAMARCDHYGIICGSDMPEEVDKEEAMNIYKILYECKCCKYHTMGKPHMHLFDIGYCPPYGDNIIPYYNRYHSKETKCKCKCMEHCEMLCREYNDEEEQTYEIEALLKKWHNIVNDDKIGCRLHLTNIIDKEINNIIRYTEGDT
jgi:hypothetical protein